MNRTMEEVSKLLRVLLDSVEESRKIESIEGKCRHLERKIISAGFLHKSEIRFPEEKDKKHIKLGYGELYEVMNAEINGFNQAISETKKLNGVDDEI